MIFLSSVMALAWLAARLMLLISIYYGAEVTEEAAGILKDVTGSFKGASFSLTGGPKLS